MLGFLRIELRGLATFRARLNSNARQLPGRGLKQRRKKHSPYNFTPDVFPAWVRSKVLFCEVGDDEMRVVLGGAGRGVAE
jgi:hypothetical protein